MYNSSCLSGTITTFILLCMIYMHHNLVMYWKHSFVLKTWNINVNFTGKYKPTFIIDTVKHSVRDIS